jgi:hypothetical protein
MSRRSPVDDRGVSSTSGIDDVFDAMTGVQPP